jgi:hypothetical protein
MSRLPGPLSLLVGVVVLAGVGGGCSRGSAKAPASEDAGAGALAPSAAGSSPAPPGKPQFSPAVFSAPIAASRAHHQVVVAGLVAAEGVIRVMGLTAGPPAWSVDALHGVAWAADAELRLQPAADGVALVWRGLLGGKTGATLVVLGPHGEPRGEPIPVGAGSCTTADGVAWLDPRGAAPIHVRTRRWGESTVHDVTALSADRAPTLLCGDHDAFVLGEGDDDLTAIAFSPADGLARPSLVAIRDRDFGDDDEREHEAFTVGDDLGIVRIGGAGTLSTREISHGHASPWRRLKRALSESDDVVAVDGDAASVVVVLTREAADACPGGESGAQTVRALRVDRRTGDEAMLSLAPADCDGTPGPFWFGDAPGASVVGWSHRRARPAPNAAPIDSLVYRVFQADPPREGRVEVEADALVDAGCDDAGCSVAALLRAPDNDGGRPEAIFALTYPR